MKGIDAFSFCVTVAAGLCSTFPAPSESLSKPTSISAPWMPTGVSARMTVEGPVFVDPKGMTLYQPTGEVETCDDQPVTLLLPSTATYYEGQVNFDIRVPDLKTRRTCAQKHPPFLAPADAKPIAP